MTSPTNSLSTPSPSKDCRSIDQPFSSPSSAKSIGSARWSSPSVTAAFFHSAEGLRHVHNAVTGSWVIGRAGTADLHGPLILGIGKASVGHRNSETCADFEEDETHT